MTKDTSWIIVSVAVVAIIGGMLWYSYRPGQYDTFAACITEKEAKFFGAFWCPHCQEQKARFGKSAKHLPYIECSTPNGQNQIQACADKGIESYPTWEFADGSRQTGKLELSELASITGCALVKDSE